MSLLRKIRAIAPYFGPGGPAFGTKPRNALDRAAARHDLAYQQLGLDWRTRWMPPRSIDDWARKLLVLKADARFVGELFGLLRR